jgi:16S rRNA (cytosine967-C5)-methyltransferase
MMHVSLSRSAALDVLTQAEKGGFAEDELHKKLSTSNLSPRDRALTTELVYGVLRWRTRLDILIDHHLENPQKRLKPLIRQIFRIAVYQILFLSRVPHYAILDDAVRQASRQFGSRIASFVNATLRAVLASRHLHNETPEKDAESLATYYSHPRWLVERWLKDFGAEDTERILLLNNRPAPLICRVNTLKTDMGDLFACLEREGISFEPFFPQDSAFQVSTAGRDLRASTSCQEGLFAIQGSASQLIAPLLQAESGFRILDACAAPGGKTAHLAALCQNSASILAVDVSQSRLREMRANMHRLGVTSSEFHLGDMRNADWAAQLGTFDRILVDAPCSGLGVLRHNPDTRYRIGGPDLPLFAAQQRQILHTAAGLLLPGGKILYSVCTITREETVDILDDVLSLCPFLEIDPITPREIEGGEDLVSPEGFLQTFPPRDDVGLDGFFAARLVYRSD